MPAPKAVSVITERGQVSIPADLRKQLRLRKGQRLAWERPRPPGQLSPYRVRRGFSRLLCALGTPADAPKPSGHPPGRPRGHRSGPATRYPAIKKAA